MLGRALGAPLLLLHTIELLQCVVGRPFLVDLLLLRVLLLLLLGGQPRPLGPGVGRFGTQQSLQMGEKIG